MFKVKVFRRVCIVDRSGRKLLPNGFSSAKLEPREKVLRKSRRYWFDYERKLACIPYDQRSFGRFENYELIFLITIHNILENYILIIDPAFFIKNTQVRVWILVGKRTRATSRLLLNSTNSEMEKWGSVRLRLQIFR